jgi:hypothetical protein
VKCNNELVIRINTMFSYIVLLFITFMVLLAVMLFLTLKYLITSLQIMMVQN